MTETTRLLTRELEKLRAEDKRREERLTSLVTQLTTRLEHSTRQLRKEQERNRTLEAKVDGLNSSLSQNLTSLQDFERRWSELVQSLRRL